MNLYNKKLSCYFKLIQMDKREGIFNLLKKASNEGV